MSESFLKWYNIEDIDVSKLPLPVRKKIGDYQNVTQVGWLSSSLTPKYEDHLGMWRECWVLKIDDSGLTVVMTPWVSPPIGDYLEMIRTDKLKTYE